MDNFRSRQECCLVLRNGIIGCISCTIPKDGEENRLILVKEGFSEIIALKRRTNGKRAAGGTWGIAEGCGRGRRVQRRDGFQFILCASICLFQCCTNFFCINQSLMKTFAKFHTKSPMKIVLFTGKMIFLSSNL